MAPILLDLQAMSADKKVQDREMGLWPAG